MSILSYNVYNRNEIQHYNKASTIVKLMICKWLRKSLHWRHINKQTHIYKKLNNRLTKENMIICKNWKTEGQEN